MAEKDITNKAMFSNPDLVADLFNTIYFKGEKIINPRFILNGPTDLCLYKRIGKHITPLKREADICKLYYQGEKNPLVVLQIENQTSYDSNMKTRLLEYNELIKEDLIRQRIISSKTEVVFLNVIITYSGSNKPYVSTKETNKEVINSLKMNKEVHFIREFRPKKEQLQFTTDIGVFFKCISLSYKRYEKELNNYVKENLKVINSYVDMSIL